MKAYIIVNKIYKNINDIKVYIYINFTTKGKNVAQFQDLQVFIKKNY